MTPKHRKHYSQMSAAEVGWLAGYTRNVLAKNLGGMQHFYHRASDRHFTFAQALDAVSAGKPIEVSQMPDGEVRALFRRQSGPNAGTCTVVSLTQKSIVTVFYNDPMDQHDTLNHNLYRWNVNVVEVIKSLRRAA